MSRLSTTFATAGAAALLVLASFGAGAASMSNAPVSAATPPPPNIDDTRVGAPPPPMALPTAERPAEQLFVPIASCRVIDTRATSRFGNGTTRSYYIAGDTGFEAQGGKAGGCAVPAGATAVAATVLAYQPTAAGRLKSWAAGGAEPVGSVLRYAKATGMQLEATLALKQGTGKGLTIKNFSAKTHVVVDIVGYYVPQMYAYLSSSGTILDQSGRVVSATRIGVGQYAVVWDRDISSCAGVASSDVSDYIESVYTSGNTSYVYVYNNAGAASDYWVNLVITC